MVYDAEISLCVEDRNWQEINVLSDTKLINKGKYMLKEYHYECINLPETFSLLAKSNVCDNEAMKHKEKNQFGVQFHPEVSGEKGKLILENFTKHC
jgi:GMP synthase-like glutamine amidotransferase